MYIIKQFKKNIKYYLCVVMAIPLLFGSFSGAVDDLLWQAINPSYNGKNISQVGKNVDSVGNAVIKGGIEAKIGLGGADIKGSPSIIVKVTRILLSLTIALAVTMILYNGMIYIVKTGQGEDGKNLTKNVAYVVIGILIALFSVVIITLIRSVPETLNQELHVDYDNSQDNRIVERGKKIGSFGDILKKIF